MIAKASPRPEFPHACPSSFGEACPHAADFLHLQKLESLGLVVGQVAHDMNNALAILLGNAEMAIDEAPPTGPLATRLLDIRESVVQASALCRGMLAYAGRASPARIEIDLPKLVSDLQPWLQVTLPGSCHLECQVAPDLPPLIGDPGHLRQILMSLIFNAVEALDGKSGKIRLDVESGQARDDEASEASLICIRISDTGGGVEATVLKSLFQPFYSTRAPGRGLGLTAVLALVKSMSGSIKVSSVPGQGTVFSLHFPVRNPAEAEAVLDLENRLDDESKWIGSGTVLLVDDEPELLMVGSALLGESGVRVLTASNGQEAVEIFRQNADEIELVFLDAMMPKMDGREALSCIRQIDPAMRVVLISGHDESDLESWWEDSRPNEILLKPVSARQLRRVAKRHLAYRAP